MTEPKQQPETEMVAIPIGQWMVARGVLLDGASDEAVAARLGVKTSTVKTQLRRLFRNLELEGGRTALAVKVWSGRIDLVAPHAGSLRKELERAVRASAAA